MPFCPQCGYEYEKGVAICPDCSQPLAPAPPTSTRSTAAGWPPADQSELDSTEALVVVYETTDEAIADVILASLEDAGIPVAEQYDRAPLGNGLGLGAVEGLYARLLVPESRADEAQRIVKDFLAAYDSGELEVSEEEAEEFAEDVEAEEE